MKSRKLLLALLLIGIVPVVNVTGRIRTRPRRPSRTRVWPQSPQQTTFAPLTVENSKEVEFELGYEFSVPGKTSAIKFVALLPQTIPGRQKILDMNYSQEPARVFSENQNQYAEFVFIKPERRFEVQINIKAELFRYDLSTARDKQAEEMTFEDADLQEFLKQEKYIEKDHSRIRQIAENIIDPNEIDTVKSIYEYVAEKLEYGGPADEELGAVTAVQCKKGDCTEYSDLFVALCRAKDIPARVATGFTVRSDDVGPKHHWAEVYLQEYGWVPFEPCWGDVQSAAIRDMAFYTLKPIYIYLSRIRNDEVLHNNHFYAYTYWGDKVTLADSIEFKHPAEPNSRSQVE